MITDSERVNVHANRVMGNVDFATRLLSYLEETVLRAHKVKFTGPTDSDDLGGFFTTVTMTDGSGSNMLDLSGSSGGIYGTDGTGRIISLVNGDDRINEVPFADAGATTYHVALKAVEVPSGISQDTVTGAIYYDRHRQDVGYLAEPSAAAASGGGIQFTLANHKLNAADTFTGRTAICYLKDPVTNSPASAIEEATISGTTVTTTGKLGQSVVSTTASDYEVVILGPVITRQDISASVGYAYVGSVVGGGSPRTFSHTSQVSLVSSEETSIYQDRTSPKGWVNTKPTVTNTSTAISVTATGIALVNGRAVTAPTSGPHGSLAATSDIFLSYDAGTSSYVVSTTWDNANSSNRVPLVYAKTDGASNIVAIANIGRLVEEFPEALTLSVSDDITHRGSFRSMKEALACAASLKLGSTLTPRGTIIEVIGDITVGAEINDHELFPAGGVTIRGRGPQNYSSAGGRIVFSATTGSLFHCNDSSGRLAIAFEDLAFRISGVNTDASSAIVKLTGGAAVVTFRRCVVDGNGSLSGSGGASGKIAHVVSASGGTGLSISAFDCLFLTSDTLARCASGGPGMTCVLERVSYVASGVIIGTVEGGVIDEQTTNALSWRFADCEILARGPCVSGDKFSALRIRGCTFETTGVDHIMIAAGISSYDQVQKVWIENNFLRTAVTGSGVNPVIRIRAKDLTTAVPPGIFIIGNRITGDGDGTTCKGIEIGVNSADLTGVVIRDNVINECNIGVYMVSAGAGVVSYPMIRGNFMNEVGIAISSDAHNGAYIAENVAHVNGGNALILDGQSMVFGNMVIAAAASLGSFVGNGTTIIGNFTRFCTDMQLTGDKILVAANNTDALVNIDTSADDLLVIGNLLTLVTLDAGDQSSVIGNICTAGPSTINDAPSSNAVVVGNRFGGSLTVEADVGVVTGNVVESGGITLAAASSDIAAVGNYGTVIDLGTTNVVANNAT